MGREQLDTIVNLLAMNDWQEQECMTASALCWPAAMRCRVLKTAEELMLQHMELTMDGGKGSTNESR